MAYMSPHMMDVVGSRWSKRIHQLDSEQRRSPYLWKIVADYHWLEIVIDDCARTLERQAEAPEPNALMGRRFGS